MAGTDQTPPRVEDLPDLLTVEEYARFTRRHRGGAYEDVRTGIVPSIRLGRVIRIPREALRRALLEEPEPQA
jgi:excisionase family DNA binding protein